MKHCRMRPLSYYVINLIVQANESILHVHSCHLKTSGFVEDTFESNLIILLLQAL